MTKGNRRGLVLVMVGVIGVLVLTAWIGVGAGRRHAGTAMVRHTTAHGDDEPGSRSQMVASVAALLDALADDKLDEIVVADGTYRA